MQEELDEQLERKGFRKIRAHLLICPNCAAYLESLKRTVALARRMTAPRVSKKMHKKLFALLERGLQSHESREAVDVQVKS